MHKLAMSHNASLAELQISPDLSVQQKKSGRLYIQVVVVRSLYADILMTRTNMSQTRPLFSRQETDDTNNTDYIVGTDYTDYTDVSDNTDDTDDTFGILLGHFWETFEKFLGYFWDIFGILSGYFWDTLRILLGYFWDTFGLLSGYF